MKSHLIAPLLGLASSAFAYHWQGGMAKVSPFVQQQMQTTDPTMPVLVVLKAKADLSGAMLLPAKEDKGHFVYRTLVRTANTSQAPLVALLKQRQLDYERFYSINMIAVYEADAALVQELAQRDDVAEILGNPAVPALSPVPSADHQRRFQLQGTEESVTATGAPRVWNELHHYGEGIVVASQDSGVKWDHPAIKMQYRGYQGKDVDHNYHWYDASQRRLDAIKLSPCGHASPVPCDDHGHGTHTIGTVLGSDGAGNQIGMAPQAQWMACRNMDNGIGRPSSYIRCFEFFLAPFPLHGDPFVDGRPELAPHVVTNSWNCDASEGCTGHEFVPSLQALKAAGIITIVSAGNLGPSCGSIRNQPSTISGLSLRVGAYDHRTGKIAIFSSRGPSVYDQHLGPEVVAPGVSIRSSVLHNLYDSIGWSGTSMAAPHVAGEVALLLSANPSLIGQVDRVFALITSTAKPKTSSENCGGVDGATIPNNTFGYGIIDAFAATKKAMTL